MGGGVVEKLVELGVEVDIGDINVVHAFKVAESLKNAVDITVVKTDVLSRTELITVARKYDVVVNTVGPFYKYGFLVAETLVKAGVNAVNICYDHDAAEKILGLFGEASANDVTCNWSRMDSGSF